MAQNCLKDSEVVFPERADLGDVVAELGRPLEAAAESEAAPLLGVDPDVLEHLRVDHPGAPQLDPAGELAHAAALEVAVRAGDIGLDGRLGEGEVVRAEPHLAVVAEEHAHDVQKRPLEIGERDAAVDGEAFELVEDGEARGRDLVASVNAADRDHVDRGLLRLHRVDLRRRGLGPEQTLRVDEEGVARRTGRMRRRKRELVEVVVRGLDLAVVDDVVAEAEERVLDEPADVCRRMEGTDPALVAGKGDVDALLSEPAVEIGALERLPPCLDLCLQTFADRVQEHPGLAVADVAERLGELALAAQVAHTRILEPFEGRRARNRAHSLRFEGFRIHRANVSSAPSSHRSFGATSLLPTAIVSRKSAHVCADREPK